MRSSTILPALFTLSYSVLALALPVSHVNTLTDPYAHTVTKPSTETDSVDQPINFVSRQLSPTNNPPTLFGRQMIRPDWRNAVAPAAIGGRE